MVKVSSFIGGFFLITILLTTGCNQETNPDSKHKINSSSAQLKKILDTDNGIPKEEPFTLRQFMPYINDTWIGNAVCYGCYREGQAPGQTGPTEQQLLEDLNIISRHWNLIRLYGADQDTENILKVIKNNDLPIKVILGVWLEPETDTPDKKESNVTQTLRSIMMADQYADIIVAISVGNETQVFWSGHIMKPENLVKYIRAIRANVNQPVTTADDYNFWNKEESKDIANEVDFIFTHIHPLWNGRQLDEAISWMDSVYNDIKNIHQGKPVIIAEVGWATDYNADKNGPGEQGSLMKGEVSVRAQAEFLLQLKAWVDSSKVTTFWFEVFDEPWKGGGEASPENEVEKHWGLFYENRTSKQTILDSL